MNPEVAADIVRGSATSRNNPESFERAVSFAVDRDWPLPIGALELARREYAPRGLRHVTVALERATALTRGDPNLLRAVLADYEQMHAQPMIGRVRCELGRLIGEAGLLASGLQILRELDDQLQVARFQD
jgi:hypothetical protein